MKELNHDHLSVVPTLKARKTKAGKTFLQTKEIEMIEEALGSLGDYGEVRLVVEKGRLRYLITQKSYDALKWLPGSLVHNLD